MFVYPKGNAFKSVNGDSDKKRGDGWHEELVFLIGYSFNKLIFDYGRNKICPLILIAFHKFSDMYITKISCFAFLLSTQMTKKYSKKSAGDSVRKSSQLLWDHRVLAKVHCSTFCLDTSE